MIFELVQIPKKTVITAGQKVQLYHYDIVIFGITLQALGSNTGSIYLGDSRVSSSQYIQEMLAYDSFDLEIGKFFKNAQILASDLWIDSSVNGEGVSGGIVIAKDISKVYEYIDYEKEQVLLLKELLNIFKEVKV